MDKRHFLAAQSEVFGIPALVPNCLPEAFVKKFTLQSPWLKRWGVPKKKLAKKAVEKLSAPAKPLF